MRVKSIVEDIQRALANLTGLVVNETSEMARSDMEACAMYEEREVRAGEQRLRTPDCNVPSEPSGMEENAGSQTLRTRRSVSPVCKATPASRVLSS